jgi:hypothetical protein
MRKRVSRIAVIAAMTLSGSYLFASGNLACGSMGTEAGIGTADMCFIFDCTNGAFGGLLDPCANVPGSDTGNPDQGGGGYEGPRTGSFFADCPTDDDQGG